MSAPAKIFLHILCISTLFMCGCSKMYPGAPQSCFVSGRIIDLDTGFGVPNVTVYVDDIAVSTDLSGDFVKLDLPVGRHHVTIAKGGYVEKSVEVVVLTGGAIDIGTVIITR
jgi:hypothetical protein